MEGCELLFTDDSLRVIANKAMQKGTGARGLRSILEGVMLDIMYDLPEQPKGSKFVITEEIVLGDRFQLPESKSA
jgi:ATP-dependent Clp protease ATP-binding subunit ClpX